MNQRDTITRNPRLYSDVETVSRSSSPASTSTTLRPRNKRISTTEQELISTSGTSTPSLSRGVSPIPSKHLSRSSANTRENGSPGRQPAGNLMVPTTGRGSSRSSSPVGASIGSFLQSGWSNSWTTLQGVANSVLGGDLDIGTPTESANNGIYKHRRKASSNPTKPPSTWGPSSPPKRTESGIGEGSTAAREEELRRRRTAGVLESHEGMVNGGLDINGRYKRRMSLEDTRTEDEVADALVYIHHVQPHDTIAGVVLKYNCQMAVFKKANRLWAQDTIQVRKVLFLPVDACAIKGRPCDAPSTKGVDLLAPTPSAEDGPNTNGGSWPKFNSQNETPAERLDRDEDAPWIHVRWVLLDSSPSSKPVEIARMPRKTLGYFPPRRRKSQATISTISTPRDSMDIPRSSDDRSGSAASTPNRRTSLLGPRPSSGSYFPPTSLPARSGRPRRESTSEAAERLGWMRGPGGVGTLSGKNVRMPGPARDGLNTFANKHIPGLAIDNLPSTSVLGSETAQFGFSGEEPANIAEAPFGSTSISGAVTTSGQNLGLENAAAAVEGFFRRIVTKVPGTPRLGGTPTAVDGGDLIELLDGAGSDDGRGFELSPGSVRIGGSGREDLEGLVRGRVSAAVKGGKTD